jgi:biotin carboxyl carrier protein
MFCFTAPEDGIVGAFLAKNGEPVKESDPVFLYYFEKNRN